MEKGRRRECMEFFEAGVRYFSAGQIWAKDVTGAGSNSRSLSVRLRRTSVSSEATPYHARLTLEHEG